MKFELFVAIRYLRAKRKQTMVSVISAISVLGIAAGVMALILALALATGEKEEIQDKILGITPAVNLLRMDGSPIRGYENLIHQLVSLPHVKGSAPAIIKQVFINNPRSNSNQGAMLKGVDPNLETGVSDFFKHLIVGDPHALDRQLMLSTDRDSAIIDKIIIGKEMARTLGAGTGDILEIFYMGRVTPLGMSYFKKKLKVAAIFQSDFYDSDANWAYVNINSARRLFSYPPASAYTIQFRIDDLDRTEEVAENIRNQAGEGFITTTWIELNKPLFSAFKLQKLAFFLTISLIVFVASLNVVTTLIMMVLEKQGDIAILDAMGATAKTIHRVFMFQGLIIGVIGTVIGNILGIAISWILDTYQLIPLEPEIYSIPYVPFHVRVWDAVLISATALLISYLATIYPARRASKLDPVEVLRYE
jgi:lipoprotein-releasing system permease protein